MTFKFYLSLLLFYKISEILNGQDHPNYPGIKLKLKKLKDIYKT